MAMDWVVYMIHCSDDTFYTGITNNLERRLTQHANNKGAKYFRGRQPKQVVYVETGHNRSSASQREAAIKKLNRDDKNSLVASTANEVDEVMSANELQ